MKKIILIFLLVNTSGLLNAQGNLQFNSALFESFTYFDQSNIEFNVENILSFDVPSGKIWKITEAIPSRIDDATSSTTPNTPNTNGGKWSLQKSGSNEYHIIAFGDGSAQGHINNLWLGEGTYFLSLNRSPSTAYRYNLLLSGIEYNITP